MVGHCLLRQPCDCGSERFKPQSHLYEGVVKKLYSAICGCSGFEGGMIEYGVSLSFDLAAWDLGLGKC
eukprot:scaffold153605_cov30-Prasinocladus_malaysianus.AAC.1